MAWRNNVWEPEDYPASSFAPDAEPDPSPFLRQPAASQQYGNIGMAAPSPALRQPEMPSSGGGGSFWGGVLDLLRNVPITLGDRKHGQTTLPSYNEMTAGRRLTDFGKAQGLDMGTYGGGGSVSPGEAQFAVREGLRKRDEAPLGPEEALKLFPYQPGESPETDMHRAFAARLRQKDIGSLYGHLVTQYGLPGMGGSLSDTAGFELPPPNTTPGQPSLENGALPTQPVAPGVPAPQAPIVGKLDSGRPIIRHPDGAYSTHINKQMEFDGKVYNVPTLYGGKQVTDQEAGNIMKQTKLIDPDTGRPLTPYNSIEEARAAYATEHDAIDREVRTKMEGAVLPSSTTSLAVQPPVPTIPARPPGAVPTVTPVAQVQPQAPSMQPAPAAAPLAAQGLPPTRDVMALPPRPTRPSGQVTLEEQQRHPSVLAAEEAYRLQRTMQNRAALLKARQASPALIRQEQRKQYDDAHRQWGEDIRTWVETRRAMMPDWKLDKDLTTQILIDNPTLPAGSFPTQPMISTAATNLAARQAEDKAREEGLTTKARLGANYQNYLDLPLHATEKERATHWYYTDSGTPLETSRTGAEAEALARAGKARQVSVEDHRQLAIMGSAADVMQEGARLTKKAYSILDGQFGKMTPAERANPAEWVQGHWDQITQDHPEIIQAQRFWAGSAQLLARGVSAAKGDLNAQELEKANALAPQMMYLANGLGVSVGANGVKIGTPSQLIPDTREVALRTLDNTTNLLNGRAARILGKPGFQYPGLTSGTESQYAKDREEQERQRAKTPAAPMTPAAAAQKKLGEFEKTGAAWIGEQVGRVKKAVTGPPAPPPSPTAAPMQQAYQTSLKQHGITAPPNPSSPEFQAFMATVYQQLGRYRKDLSPAQLAELTKTIAQKYGGTWQPQ